MAKKLIAVARPAMFGRGEKTLTDTGVRDAWELTPDPRFEARMSVAVPGRDAAFVQLVQHGGVIDGKVLAESCQGAAEVVEVDGVVDLLR